MLPSRSSALTASTHTGNATTKVRDYYAEKRRSTTLLIVNVFIFFALALIFFAIVWSVFHLLDNYNKFYNNNNKLYRDALELIRMRCQPQAMQSGPVVYPATVAALNHPKTADGNDDDNVLHPDLHAAKQKMDSLYDIRNQQLLQAEQALNDICKTAREHANMNVWLKSQQQAVAELLHHMWPINWFGCTPGDQSNSCHYAIFTSLSYLTHSANAHAPTSAGGGGASSSSKIDVFQTPIQMMHDFVKLLALAVLGGTILTVLLVMFCQRTAAYTIQVGTLSLLVLIVGSSLIWNAVLTLWAMIKLVAACVLVVVFLMGPALSLVKFIASTKIVKNLEDRFREAQASIPKRGVSVQQTVAEHAQTDPSGLFSQISAQLDDVWSPFEDKMRDWRQHVGQFEGLPGDRNYHTMPAMKTKSKAA